MTRKSSDAESLVSLTIENDVARITVCRPDSRNALSLAVNQQISAHVKTISQRPSVRAVVITGQGDKAFCAGADLKERKGVSAEDTPRYVDAIAGAINDVATMSAPTIAAMNGSAFGGGLELALACDFRIAVEDAQFALSEVRLGILPGAGGTQRLPRLVGVAAAKELILLGRRVSATRAFELGLVNQVAPREKFLDAVEAIVTELKGCAPVSVASAKRAIEGGLHLSMKEGLALERACYEKTLFTEDRNEGLRAFAEKRPPNFQGK